MLFSKKHKNIKKSNKFKEYCNEKIEYQYTRNEEIMGQFRYHAYQHTKLGHKESPVIVFLYWYWLHSQHTLNCLRKMQILVASY